MRFGDLPGINMCWTLFSQLCCTGIHQGDAGEPNGGVSPTFGGKGTC
jgi:hypothetical protein